MTAPPPTVVVLHGLARTHRSVAGLRRHIERAGFPTWSRTYPSRRMGIAELAREVAERIRADVPGEVMAVTHSLGGILVRHMADLLPWRGLVMIAPPNRGSRVALALRDHPLYRWFYGPAGQEVTSPGGWPAPPTPFGVIAGTGGVSVGNPVSWLSRAMRLLPPEVPSDGTVAVDETRHPAAADFITAAASHTWIHDDPVVRDQVVHFLRNGLFRV
ncbi:MAG: alpha/beta hydrolase [Myxococcales bacterium]|nr:alpha/beta hydrolase [Myxococcales bacterium]